MEEVRIKKGSCGFGSGKLMIEETVADHASHLFDLWNEGGRREMVIFTAVVFILTFTVSLISAFFVVASGMQFGVFLALVAAMPIFSWSHRKLKGFKKERFIPFDEIRCVKYVEGRKGLTCPRFIVSYGREDEEKKRYIMMPTHFLPGVEEDVEEMKEKFEELEVETSW